MSTAGHNFECHTDNFDSEPPIVTVLTPSYNRVKGLVNLYHSLCMQSAPQGSFQWFVADDGSTDRTRELLDKISREQFEKKQFQIKYLRLDHGGKHRALNHSIPKIASRFTFIVDSDDALTPDAIETILLKDQLLFGQEGRKASENCFAGFSFLRIRPDGSFMSKSVSKDGKVDTYVNERINRYNVGDMAEVWVTDILRQYPFPEFPGEYFLGEDTVWIRISGPHVLQFFNKAIYRSDYQQDGLTNNRRLHNLHSPNGCVERALTFLTSPDIRLICKFKPAMQYWIYGRIAGRRWNSLWESGPKECRGLLTFVFIPSVFLEKRWKRAL